MLRGGSQLLLEKLAPAKFFSALASTGIANFYGVPDSLLKDFCAYVTDTATPESHVITSNEGAAVSMATGYHLATGKVPCVYMQNSGFGNTMNPLLSLTHKQVYSVPMLLLIGWRGDPQGKKDEPQHIAQGRLMEDCLKSCEVPYSILDCCVEDGGTEASMNRALAAAKEHFATHNSPYAILVQRDTFETYKLQNKMDDIGTVSREEAIEAILSALAPEDIVVSTTGMPSREVFEVRARNEAGHHRDFLTVGSMGHCSAIASGIALAKPDRNVYVIDGDGASVMHMGTLAVHGALHSTPAPGIPYLSNLKHIVVNNGAHDSVGGQPTAGGQNVGWITNVAKASGYTPVSDTPVQEKGEIAAAVAKMGATTDRMTFLEIVVKKGNRKDLGRPTTTPLQNKDALMAFIRDE